MRNPNSTQRNHFLVGAIPTLGMLPLAAFLATSTHWRSVGVASALAAALLVLCALLAARAGWELRRVNLSLNREVERLTAEPEPSRDNKNLPTSAKKARGRRDAFNELLQGFEEQARQVQADRDNLEQLVEQRTLALQRRNVAMRLVLDNVGQGLATIQLDGTLSPERSRAFDEWFGVPAADLGFEQHLAKQDSNAQAMLRLGWEQLRDDSLPLECSIYQMPSKLKVVERHYGLEYRPIFEKEVLQGVLLVATDLTEQQQQFRRDVAQRELIDVFERFVHDRSGFLQFFHECDSIVSSVLQWESQEMATQFRAVHTLKGNCAFFGVTSVAEAAHELETSVIEAGAPGQRQLAALGATWRGLSERVKLLVGDSGQPSVEVPHDEFQELVDAIAERLPHTELALLTERLKHERVVLRLQQAADQAQTLARRLGKAELQVEVSAANQLRFPADDWAPFWAGFVHVVRNAVDHGLEHAEQRRNSGKSESGTLRFSAFIVDHHFIVELADDGGGIDWERVRIRARERGLPHTLESDLVEALFADGVSTAESVSDVSGRGVGLSAVREATRALGGSVLIKSTRGQGTTVRFSFPMPDASNQRGVSDLFDRAS